MKVVGYSQPQIVAAQKTNNKPATDGKNGGNKPQGNKPNGNKPQGGNKPQNDAVKADEAKAENGADAELAQVAEKKPRVIIHNVIDKKGKE